MNATNKKYLKDNFNINADDYSPDTLKKVLEIINRAISSKEKVLIDKNKELEALIDYYETYLENN